MIKIEIKGKGLKRFEKAVQALAGPASQKAYAVALNEVGPVARNKVVKAVGKQMGVKGAVVAKRGNVRASAAMPGHLTYAIDASGGHLLLKDFNPSQSAKGVRAGPWGRRLLFRGSFIQSTKLGGNVMHRLGPDRLPIQNMFGPAVPKEMVKGEAEKVFQSYVAQRLPKRIAHQIKRATKGAFD